MNVQQIRLMHRALCLLTLVLLLTQVAFADCLRDINGEVYCGWGRCLRDHDGIIWCSRYYEGDAQLTRRGKVLCGKGKCARTSRGEIFCSSEEGGAVMKDSRGRIRCFGRCDPATEEHCEHTPADSAG